MEDTLSSALGSGGLLAQMLTLKKNILTAVNAAKVQDPESIRMTCGISDGFWAPPQRGFENLRVLLALPTETAKHRES